MNINQNVLNTAIPTKLLSWYKQFIVAANKILEEEDKDNSKKKETKINIKNE